MDKFIIAVDLYKTDAEERHWLEALGAIQTDVKTYPNVVWLAKNIALLDHTQTSTIGPKLLLALRNQQLRYKLYGACDYPKELAIHIENYP